MRDADREDMSHRRDAEFAESKEKKQAVPLQQAQGPDDKLM